MMLPVYSSLTAALPCVAASFVSLVCSRALYDKRISQEVEGEALGDEFAGYVSAISVVRRGLSCVPSMLI